MGVVVVYGVKESSMNNAREIVLGSLDDTDTEWTLCWGLSPSVRAVITKYHRPGGLNNSNLFLVVLETGKCKRRPSAPLVLMRVLVLAAEGLLLLGPQVVGRYGARALCCLSS